MGSEAPKVWQPNEVILRIAQVAHAIGWQANVGGMELAGQFVSVLARHPDLIDRFLAEGSELCIEGLMGPERGCLTFYNMKGEITTPQELSAAREVQKMKRAASAAPSSGDRP
jgi:hypothetical protein